MANGILYGVSVGPGDPGLITLNALETIKKCPIIAAPRTSGGTAALDIVSQVVELSHKNILNLDYAMVKDADARREKHDLAAQKLRTALLDGQDVAMICLGDISVYGSFEYIKDGLGGEFEIQTIAGVPSFCAAASSLGISLTSIDKPLHLIPCSFDLPNEELSGTKIYMKSASQLNSLLQRLEAAGKLEGAILMQNCGMKNEKVYHGRSALDASNDYFSIVIIKE